MPGWLRSRWALLVGLLAVGVAVAVVVSRDVWDDPPPLTAAEAHPTADVDVMPNRAVPAFLRAQGVRPQRLRMGGGTAVVAHLTWKQLRPAGDNRYEVLLAGNACQPGAIDSVLGVPVDDASLGFDSGWNDRLQDTPWLRGDADRRTDEGYTNDAQIASVPASYDDVWIVGRVLDACGVDESQQFARPVTDPDPVVGVALTTGDRIWWVDRVSG